MLKNGAVAIAALALLTGTAFAQDKRVTVYTAVKASVADALAPRFEKETGIKVDLVKAGSGDILKRVKAEAGAPKADVIWSIGGEQLEDSKDLLQAFTPAADADIIPAYKVSPEWVPYNGIVAVFSVNSAELKPEAYPKTWKDLADPKWKGKISSARADTSGSAYQQLATIITIYGETEGWDIAKKILANTVLSDSSGAVPRFVNDGEALVGLTLEDGALDYVRGGGNVAIVYPEDGTSTVADGMALVKGGPNADNGKKFINWLLTKDVQEYLVKEVGRRSVRKDVGGAGMTPITRIKLAKYDIKAAAASRTAYIAKWKELLAAR